MNTKSMKTKRALKIARKAFPKLPHSTRAFTAADYQALPKGNKQ